MIMNFLVLINGAPKYKYFYAELAKIFEEKGHQVYFAVNAQKSTILEPLEYIDYSDNTFFFDDYLKRNFRDLVSKKIELSETWGDIFYSDFDRFFSHIYNLKKDNEYWHAVLNGLEGFFKKIIVDKKIDIILYENISNSFAYMAYTVGSNLGCTYIGLGSSRLPGRYEIQTSIYSESKYIVSGVEDKLPTSNEKKWYEDYKKHFFETQPDYMKNNTLNKKVDLSNLISYRKVITVKNYLKVYLGVYSYYDYQSGSPIDQLTSMYKLNWTKRKNEKSSYKYYLSIKEVDKLIKDNKEDFYIYPTHYHPESSTSVLAPDYTDELSNIINIHNNLPAGTYLYVKDHISARGTQNEMFYRKISALPGVRLIHFDYNVKKLIGSSLGVITITSTVGYEAILMNKPVYLFGRVFYEDFPNVYKIKSFLQLRDIQKLGTEIVSPKDIMKYVIAYYRYTFEGKILIGEPDLWSEAYFKGITNDIFNKIESVHKI